MKPTTFLKKLFAKTYRNVDELRAGASYIYEEAIDDEKYNELYDICEEFLDKLDTWKKEFEDS